MILRSALLLATAVAGALVACTASDAGPSGPPTPSTSAAATLSPTSTAEATTDAAIPFRYRCEPDSPPFSLTLVSGPALAELDLHPAAGALREYLSSDPPELELPRSGWWLAGRNAQRAWFIARRVPGGMQDSPPLVQVIAEASETGWRVLHGEDCLPTVALNSQVTGAWRFDRAGQPPGPAAKRFVALVHERACSSGRGPEGRVLPPTIFYRERDILILFTISPLRGGQDCQGSPPARVVVELREPIGDRRLLDASTFPFRDPRDPL